jgi:IS5 family transposase
VAADKQQFINYHRQRNAVKGKIGEGKRRFGLGRIREQPLETQVSTIELNVLAMKLERLLELHFVFLAYWL